MTFSFIELDVCVLHLEQVGVRGARAERVWAGLSDGEKLYGLRFIDTRSVPR